MPCLSYNGRLRRGNVWLQLFLDDGLNKGLKRMLDREQEMPEHIRKRLEAELKEMESDTYIV